MDQVYRKENPQGESKPECSRVKGVLFRVPFHFHKETKKYSNQGEYDDLCNSHAVGKLVLKKK